MRHTPLILALRKQSKWISKSLRPAWFMQQFQVIQSDTVKPSLSFIPQKLQALKQWLKQLELSFINYNTNYHLLGWEWSPRSVQLLSIHKAQGLTPGTINNNEKRHTHSKVFSRGLWNKEWEMGVCKSDTQLPPTTQCSFQWSSSLSPIKSAVAAPRGSISQISAAQPGHMMSSSVKQTIWAMLLNGSRPDVPSCLLQKTLAELTYYSISLWSGKDWVPPNSLEPRHQPWSTYSDCLNHCLFLDLFTHTYTENTHHTPTRYFLNTMDA